MKKFLFLLLLILTVPAWGADVKITELPSATSVASTDITAVVINPATTPVTKKATVSTLLKNANLTISGTTNEIAASGGTQDLSTARTWTLSLPAALDLSSKNIILPSSTTLTSADCDSAAEAGRVFVDTNATSGQQLYICEGSTGWKLQNGLGSMVASKWCAANALGTAIDCTEDTPGGSEGVVTAVGDCTGGDCLDGSGDGGTWIKFYDANGFGKIVTGDLTAERTWTMPDATGTVALTTSTVASATAATALAANGTNCSAGQAPLGVDASGNAESCFTVMQQSAIDTSAEIAAIVTDEVGSASSGKLVFNNAPTFTGTVTATAFVGNGAGLTGLSTSFTNSSGLAALLSDETGTGYSVFSDSPIFSTKLTLPNLATPSVSAVGQLSFDNNLWATGRGAAVLYDGTASTALIGALVTDVPSNGQVLKWNTGGTITWEADNNSAAITAADTEVIFADGANSPAGDSGLTYNKTTNVLTADGFDATPVVSPAISFVPATAADTDFIIGDYANGGSDDDHFQIAYGSSLNTQVAVDVDNAGNVLLPLTNKTACTTVFDLAASDDNIPAWSFDQPVTVNGTWCTCSGDCTTKATFTLENETATGMTITGTNPTCTDLGTKPTKAAVTANNAILAQGSVLFSVTNSPTTGDTYQLCVSYRDTL